MTVYFRIRGWDQSGSAASVATIRGGFWLWVVLVSLFSLLSAAGSAAQPSPPPSKAPIISNASLITAEVLKYSTLDTKALKPSSEQTGSEQTLYTLVLEVRASEGVGDIVNLVKVGERLEVICNEPVPPDVTGKTIQGTVRLRGDEWGQRYWLQEIRWVNPQGSQR